MTDKIIYVEEKLTGKKRKLLPGDVLVTDEGVALQGAVLPIEDGWGSNVETLSADKVLTDASPVLQVLTLDQGPQVLFLPPRTAFTPFFVVLNHFVSAASLYIRGSSGNAGFTLEPGKGVKVWSDGTLAQFAEFDATFLSPAAEGSATYFFGAGSWYIVSPPATGSNVVSMQDPASVFLVGIEDYVVLEAGTIELVTVAATHPGEGQQPWQVWKNGAWLQTLATNAGSNFKSYVLSISVLPGDRIGLRYSTLTTVSTNSGNHFTIRQDTPGVSRSVMVWQNFMNGAASALWPRVFGERSINALATQSHFTDWVCPAACDAIALSWNSVTGTAHTIDLYKNGTFAESISIGAGSTGVASGLSTSFVKGDTVALKLVTALSLNNVNYALVTDLAGTLYMFGTPVGITSRYMVPNESPASLVPVLSVSLSAMTQHVVQVRCFIDTITLRGPSGLGSLELWKNGALLSSFDVDTAVRVVTVTQTVWLPGDLIALKMTATTAATAAFVYLEELP